MSAAVAADHQPEPVPALDPVDVVGAWVRAAHEHPFKERWEYKLQWHTRDGALRAWARRKIQP